MFMQFFCFLLVGPMTLKKLEKRASVQAFSGWTAKLVLFLQNTRGPVATHKYSTSLVNICILSLSQRPNLEYRFVDVVA
jgi:hypothetical protein